MSWALEGALGVHKVPLEKQHLMDTALKKYEYFRTELGVLYNADCLEILPLIGRVDLVLTDPPYGMSFVSNHRQEKYKPIINDDFFPVEHINVLRGISDLGSYFFCRWDNISQVDKPKSVLAWVKNNWSMGDLKHEHGRQWEACCFYPGANHEFKKRIPDVIPCPRTENIEHPTQKPVGVYITILEAYKKNILCLDPFIGSGTAAVACERIGRKWIGIEISEEHCATAKKRIQREVSQLKLF